MRAPRALLVVLFLFAHLSASFVHNKGRPLDAINWLKNLNTTAKVCALPHHLVVGAHQGMYTWEEVLDVLLAQYHTGVCQVVAIQMCNVFQPVYMTDVPLLVMDKSQLTRPVKHLVMPYNYETLDLGVPHRKQYFMTLIGDCSPREAPVPSGFKLRHLLIRTFQPDPRNFMWCGCGICPNGIERTEALAKYKRSDFCLITTGDCHSTNRLVETIMNDCLPVLVGPPFHSLPLFNQVKYKRFITAVFVKNHEWMNEGDVHYLQDPFQLYDLVRVVSDIAEIPALLSSLNKTALFEAMVEERENYRWDRISTVIDSL